MQRGIAAYVDEARGKETRVKRAGQMAETVLLAMEGEQEPPPLLRAGFARMPLAQSGWLAMTPTQRRNHLLGIFYGQTAAARARRAEKVLAEAVRVAQRKAGRKPEKP